MKEYITDANVVFSCLISGRENYQKLFCEYRFYLPDFALHEIQYYQELILSKTKLAPEKLKEYTLMLFNNITVVPNFLISTQSYLQAFQLCKDIDENDVAYLALSLEFDMTLLTKDEVLAKGLREKGYTKIITMKEFFEEI